MLLCRKGPKPLNFRSARATTLEVRPSEDCFRTLIPCVFNGRPLMAELRTCYYVFLCLNVGKSVERRVRRPQKAVLRCRLGCHALCHAQKTREKKTKRKHPSCVLDSRDPLPVLFFAFQRDVTHLLGQSIKKSTRNGYSRPMYRSNRYGPYFLTRAPPLANSQYFTRLVSLSAG